jgi:hypothetical protein
MASNRPSFSYNPDLPSRKWHQKWFSPIISLQNAPPTSHGTPAPTKEQGEVGQAGFQIRAWIPMDEDDDVTDEMLEQETDWWSKPGAPMRPELRAARASSSIPATVEKPTEDDVMMIDPPSETVPAINGVSENVEPVVVPSASVSPVMMLSPKAPSPLHQIDTEMPDAQLSPVHLSTVPELMQSTAHQISPQSIHLKSPSPLPQQSHFKSPSPLPTESTQLKPVSPLEPQSNDFALPPESPSKPEPSHPAEQATIADILAPSKPSPPADPLAQAAEVAAGLAIETPMEHAEHAQDAGNLSGAGGGIAGEGIVGGINEDLRDVEEIGGGGVTERTAEDEAILQESRRDLETEVVKGVEQE